MESGERLPSSTASSTTPTSSSIPSVASSVSKGGLSTGAASLSSTINPCGEYSLLTLALHPFTSLHPECFIELRLSWPVEQLLG